MAVNAQLRGIILMRIAPSKYHVLQDATRMRSARRSAKNVLRANTQTYQGRMSVIAVQLGTIPPAAKHPPHLARLVITSPRHVKRSVTFVTPANLHAIKDLTNAILQVGVTRSTRNARIKFHVDQVSILQKRVLKNVMNARRVAFPLPM